MSVSGVNGAWSTYQYANKAQKTGTNRTGFTEQLQKTGEAAATSKADVYTEYLRSEYGNVRIQSIGKGGCGDSPERVAQVNAINKAKREKRSMAALNDRRAAIEDFVKKI